MAPTIKQRSFDSEPHRSTIGNAVRDQIGPTWPFYVKRQRGLDRRDCGGSAGRRAMQRHSFA
jgi:hypothetical protein